MKTCNDITNANTLQVMSQNGKTLTNPYDLQYLTNRILIY